MAEQPRENDRLPPWALAPFVLYTLGAMVLLVFAAYLWLWSSVQSVRTPVGRTWSSQQLKTLALGVHNYEGIHHRFPPAAVFDEHGQPLLSWRVLILPYLEDPSMQALFDRFKLDEPWDSPHNMELLAVMPKVYAIGPDAKPGKTHTYRQVFVGKGAAFEGTEGLRVPEDFPDGLSNTILIVEGGEPVPWTKPQDIPFATDRPLPQLATVRVGGYEAAYADGSVHFLKKDLPEKILRALITRNGGEEIPNFD